MPSEKNPLEDLVEIMRANSEHGLADVIRSLIEQDKREAASKPTTTTQEGKSAMAGKDLGKEVTTVVHRAEVVHHGDKLVLPEGMKAETAIEVLQERVKYDQQDMSISETFDVFPWDGAKGLSDVLQNRFGWVQVKGMPGFWGPTPPSYHKVEVAPGVHEDVLWGQFTVPTAPGAILVCGIDQSDGRMVFKMTAKLKRYDEKLIRTIFADLRDHLKYNSIYRGQAIKLRLSDDLGQTLALPEPRFVDVKGVTKDQLILSRDTMAAVETNLFTPIERFGELAANGIKAKRGTLLAGTYGTGKTLAAHVAAALAVKHGITFVYIQRASELSQAVKFAQQYITPTTAAVVFCEDIDREMAGQKRTAQMDDILNIIDGIDTKRSNIMVVLTTNNVESINKAMLRPGRLDAVINVTAPDAEAVEKLIRHYGGKLIAPDADLVEAGKALAGQIPAVVSEVMNRAKLSQMRLQEVGVPLSSLSQEAVVEAAKTMRGQLELLKPVVEEHEPSFNELLNGAVERGLKDPKITLRFEKNIIDTVVGRLS